MKYKLSPKLVTFAHNVAKLPFAKKMLKPFYYAYKKKLQNNRNKLFKANALQTLNDFDKAMKSAGMNYVLMFGSMLGAVREHGFIKHDLDIDTAMWAEDFSAEIEKVLVNAGFELNHSYEIDGGKLARELTFEKNGVDIDIFFIYPAIDEYPYICSQWRPVGDCSNVTESMKKYGYVTGKRLEMPFKHGIKHLPFESLRLPVPENAEDLLAFYYGEDFMNPNPNWVEAKEYKYRKPWTDKKAIFTHR